MKWVEACREVQVLITSAREEQWRSFLQNSVGGLNPNKMWDTVKKLSGSVGGATKNENLKHECREFASPVAKVDAFMRQYAAVGSMPQSAG